MTETNKIKKLQEKQNKIGHKQQEEEKMKEIVIFFICSYLVEYVCIPKREKLKK